MTDSVAQESRVVVGRIVEQVKPHPFTQPDCLVAAKGEEGPLRPGPNGGHPARPCAAEQVQQDGLSLVVGGVAGEHA